MIEEMLYAKANIWLHFPVMKLLITWDVVLRQWNWLQEPHIVQLILSEQYQIYLFGIQVNKILLICKIEICYYTGNLPSMCRDRSRERPLHFNLKVLVGPSERERKRRREGERGRDEGEGGDLEGRERRREAEGQEGWEREEKERKRGGSERKGGEREEGRGRVSEMQLCWQECKLEGRGFLSWRGRGGESD